TARRASHLPLAPRVGGRLATCGWSRFIPVPCFIHAIQSLLRLFRFFL
ncbi:hypothetical protein JMJ77_0003289, partial [Colletotrichum scovillei]